MLDLGERPDLRLMNPPTLAFIGDSVYELLVREEIVRRYTSLPAGKLHSFTVKMVCATAQVQAFRAIEPLLTPEEAAVFKRGRNATGVTPPKHTEAADYRTATGFEALFGWLYLGGQSARLHELFAAVLGSEADPE